MCISVTKSIIRRTYVDVKESVKVKESVEEYVVGQRVRRRSMSTSRSRSTSRSKSTSGRGARQGRGGCRGQEVQQGVCCRVRHGLHQGVREGGRQKSMSVTKIIKRGHTDQPKQRSHHDQPKQRSHQKRRPPAQADLGEHPGADVHPVAGRGHDPPLAETAQCRFCSGCRVCPDQQKFTPRAEETPATATNPRAELPGGRQKIQPRAPQVYIPISTPLCRN